MNLADKEGHLIDREGKILDPLKEKPIVDSDLSEIVEAFQQFRDKEGIKFY